MGVLLHALFSRIVRDGCLVATDSRGRKATYGDGSGTPLRIRITSRRTERALAWNPELTLGEAYMDGEFVVENGSIYDFLDLICRTTAHRPAPGWVRLIQQARYLVRRVRQFNYARRARRNVAHHYDLDGRLYRLFLDEDRQYSCAYFETPGSTLDDAQLAKKRHIAAKLALHDGHRVLDIGAGWGGLGLYLAKAAAVHVTGVTLSEEQLAESRRRAEEAGLSGRIDFRLQDYRHVEGRFDRIVSVGMFEHVGVVHYQPFFRKVRELLSDDGVMVLHSIGRFDTPGTTNPWIEKYIFPGGYIPALSEVIPAIERAGLLITDVEILRLHYAETLREWRQRFMARREEAARLYDERFVRMWEFYLAGSEAAFRHQDMMVFQIQLARRQETLPLTRGYMTQAEARLAARDRGTRPPAARRTAAE